jgi:dihydrodipicolinate synthase/N-acetylneuraminate lyase
MDSPAWRVRLQEGCVIPAHPLALTAERKLDEKAQRGLTRYYIEAGAGGVAVGVHTTQFAIRDHGLLEPVLSLAAETARGSNAILVAGACGRTAQAVREAGLARDIGYHAALVSLSALREASVDEMIGHLKAVGDVLPVFGFYLQPAVGGRLLSEAFWRRAAELPSLVAIKIAPFNRYQTLDVLHGVAASGRHKEIALYTGNDDSIVADLITPFAIGGVTMRIVGGLLGQWAVGTRAAVRMLNEIHALTRADAPVPSSLLAAGARLTDLNAALFDVANGFKGCIAGIHEVLRRQGLMNGIWCLDDDETLSPGQLELIDRAMKAYPELLD